MTWRGKWGCMATLWAALAPEGTPRKQPPHRQQEPHNPPAQQTGAATAHQAPVVLPTSLMRPCWARTRLNPRLKVVYVPGHHTSCLIRPTPVPIL